MKIPRSKPTMWGSKSKLLPNKTALNVLNKSNRTINDYSKQVPTNPASSDQPLLIGLMPKR